MNDTTIVGQEVDAVSTLLSNSREYMTLTQIARAIGAGEPAVRAAIRSLSQAGQIDPIPASSGRPSRYGWLHSAPVAAPAAPEPAAEQATGDGTGTALPPVREEFRVAVDALVVGGCAGSCASCASTPGERPQPAPEAAPAPAAAAAAGAVRWLVVSGKTRRIALSQPRARALALAAVRRGASTADVFALVPVGSARRDASWID